MVTRMIEIDRVKLQDEIGKRGLTLSEVSREMGMSKNFINSVIERGTAKRARWCFWRSCTISASRISRRSVSRRRKCPRPISRCR